MIITGRQFILIFIVFFLASCSPSTQEPEKPTYKIGYMICNSEQETIQRFTPFTEYLSKKLGVSFEMEAIDTADFTKKIDGGVF